jgi:hypothetical protein
MISTSTVTLVTDIDKHCVIQFDNKDVGLIIRWNMLYLSSYSGAINVLDTPEK